MVDVVEARVEELIEDLSLYPRGGIGGPHVTRLVDALEAGEVLPPIVADKATKRVVDGWHRLRAYKRLKRPTISTIFKTYRSEADMFADAVALNRGHGLALDPYDVRRAVIRLIDYGLKPRQITGVVRLTEARVIEIQQDAAINQDDAPVALKGGLSHLRRRRLSRKQERAIERYGGMQATFYARQLIGALEAKLVNFTPAFVAAMDELIQAWREYKSSVAS